MNTFKNSTILLAAAAIIWTSGCTKPKAGPDLTNDTQKKEIISAVLNDSQVSSELLDSLMVTHHEQVMTKMHSMMKGDMAMQGNMMDQMMDMCKSDTSMCKTMMSKTMDMCDADPSKCKMMVGAMQSHPKGMTSMQGMGMCDMNSMGGMKDAKKDDHQKHH